MFCNIVQHIIFSENGKYSKTCQFHKNIYLHSLKKLFGNSSFTFFVLHNKGLLKQLGKILNKPIFKTIWLSPLSELLDINQGMKRTKWNQVLIEGIIKRN